MYGYRYSSFGKNGADSHQTLLGGILSVIFKLFIMWQTFRTFYGTSENKSNIYANETIANLT